MSLNARMSANDERLYNVNRDIAHNFEFVITRVAENIEQERWEALTRLAREHGVTSQELGAACQALCRFITVQADNPKESMAQCLSRCGFLELNELSRVIVAAYLGQIILGMHFAGVREATLNGRGPALTYKGLADAGARFASLMQMPKWKRRWYRLKQRVQRAWNAFNAITPFDYGWKANEKQTEEQPTNGATVVGTGSSSGDSGNQSGDAKTSEIGPQP